MTHVRVRVRESQKMSKVKLVIYSRFFEKSAKFFLIFIHVFNFFLNLSFILNLSYLFILYYPSIFFNYLSYFLINLILKNYYHFTLFIFNPFNFKYFYSEVLKI